jgi:hypothetical protein
LLVKRALVLLNAAFAIAILDLVSQVYLPSFVNKENVMQKKSKEWKGRKWELTAKRCSV